ncbi:sensor domain-containing diguanylate cyclase [Vogesella indigofera]|uniref:sensor domain-containing diguanylate cyclase n=1 Tax=Vogesella indigofera TaxID=45465 RepID=UPI00234F11B7|nr:sensor domain-containing diguanylate cyclase [Vogesella indigofera]MDC7711080.1 sensor domain-containing diguanylate cyclase [Vogesella indigofera]
MTPTLPPEQQAPEAQRARRLLRLSWVLTLLVLAVMWGGVIEGLRQRQSLLSAQQQTQQAEWLRLSSAAVDDRLRNLYKELQLFANDQPSLARDATQLFPLQGGSLWLVDASQQQQLRGQQQPLSSAAVQQVRQWLQSPAVHPALTVLPLPVIDKRPGNSELLQVVLPLCELERCHSALTGFLRVSELLDPEQLVDHPAYAVLDINGSVLASNGSMDFNGHNLTQVATTRLGQVPLLLAANYRSSQIIRSFNLFALSLLGVALVLSCLLLLLMWRISQILLHVEHSSSQFNHAQQLLALTNSSLREKMRTLIDEQRDQQTLIETVQVGVLIVDASELSILTSNDAAARMLGMSRQMLQRQTLPALFHNPQRCEELLAVLQEQQIVTDREAQLNNHNHKVCWSMTSMRYLQFRERHAIAVSLIDITERIAHAQRLQDEKQATERALAQLQATQHELYQRATLDDLTGLANRRHFLSFAGKALERARLADDTVAVALIDLDHFKNINDHYGHAAGDAALQHFASNLRAALPDSAMAGRMGGEEFALLLPDTSLGEAHAIVDVLRNGIAAQCFHTDGQQLQLTFSAGVVASRNGHAHDLSELLKLADKALYRAKANGRNCVESIAP